MNVESQPRFSFLGANIYMIGIGGCGMSGAAVVLSALGARVSGSDRQPFDGAGSLVARGISVYLDQHEAHLPPDTDLVVVSAAIPASNPDLVSARRRGVRVLKYAELLGLLMRERQGVAIAGTHGKSTTTAMVAHVFRTAGLDPTHVVGAACDQIGGSAVLGRGPHMIVEACEFDRSFLQFDPLYGAILNLEPDHLDCYTEFGALVDAFAAFAGRFHPDGLLVCNGHDLVARRASEAARCRVEHFTIAGDGHWNAVGLIGIAGCYGFSVHYGGARRFDVQLVVPGLHNVGNALAAAAVADGAGVPAEAIVRGLGTFRGVGRRMTLRGSSRGVTIIDDYAHHPTEIRCTIQAAQGAYTHRRTVVVFQPHQYSRTRYLLDEFAASFGGVDEVLVPDVYDARGDEATERTVGSPELVRRMTERGVNGRYMATLDEVTEHVASHAAEGDLVLTLGAGDVWKVANGLVARLCPAV